MRLAEKALTKMSAVRILTTINWERRNQQMPVVKRLALTLTTLWLTAQTALAAGGGGELIVIVARHPKTHGDHGLVANLYNESHLLFTLLTVVLIPVIGSFSGYGRLHHALHRHRPLVARPGGALMRSPANSPSSGYF